MALFKTYSAEIGLSDAKFNAESNAAKWNCLSQLGVVLEPKNCQIWPYSTPLARGAEIGLSDAEFNTESNATKRDSLSQLGAEIIAKNCQNTMPRTFFSTSVFGFSARRKFQIDPEGRERGDLM